MDESILDRKLPFSMIAEQSLLGSILIDPECLNELTELVSSDDFYLAEHKQIFLAMHELYLTNHSIDVVTLIDALVRGGVYDKSGGAIHPHHRRGRAGRSERQGLRQDRARQESAAPAHRHLR